MAHSYSNNLVHCVFSTKGRVNLISDERQENLYAYLFGIAKNLKFEILAIGVLLIMSTSSWHCLRQRLSPK